MTIQRVNLGTAPTGTGGDTERSAFVKLDANFGDSANAASRLVGKNVDNIPAVDGAKAITIDGVYYGGGLLVTNTSNAGYVSTIANNNGTGNGTAVSHDYQIRGIPKVSSRTIEQSDGSATYEISVTPAGNKDTRRDVVGLTVTASTTKVPSITAGATGVAVATKKITGTYSNSSKGVSIFGHGLDATKILEVAMVVDKSPDKIPQNTNRSGLNYTVNWDTYNIVVNGIDDGNLLNLPTKIFITYEV